MSQLRSRVTVTSCSFYIKCLMYQHCCWTTNGVINETLWQFSQPRDISPSGVATPFRCGGIFSDDIIANFLLILIVKKKIENWLISYKVIRHTKIVPFLGHPVCHLFCTHLHDLVPKCRQSSLHLCTVYCLRNKTQKLIADNLVTSCLFSKEEKRLIIKAGSGAIYSYSCQKWTLS